MEKINLKGLDETVFHEKLSNGLNIYVLRKDNYTFGCYFITNFGALTDEFVPIGEKEYHKFPKGVAHFLEHKMFEQESGKNVMETFASLGGACNAFTNYEFTVYYVSGVDNFKENLNFLIDYVQSPYFTNENVEKEKGIIDQERLMTLDNPYRTFYMKCLENVFVNYEYGKSIVGEKEDIYNITKEDLYRCYNTFYNPSNMALIVVSNEKEEDVINLIKSNQETKKFPKQTKIKIKKKKEVKRVNKKYDVIYENVTKPQANYAIKLCLDDYKDINVDQLGSYIRILLVSNFSKLSEFNLKLKKKNIINGNLGFSCSKYDNYAVINVSATIENEEKFIKEIKKQFKNLDKLEETFNRIKKNMIANFVYNFTTTNSIMGYLCSDYYEYKTIKSNEFEDYKNLNYKEYVDYIERLNFKNVSITIMRPNKDKE